LVCTKHGNIIHSWKKAALFFYVLVRAFEKNRRRHRKFRKICATLRAVRHGLHTYNLLPTPLLVYTYVLTFAQISTPHCKIISLASCSAIMLPLPVLQNYIQSDTVNQSKSFTASFVGEHTFEWVT